MPPPWMENASLLDTECSYICGSYSTAYYWYHWISNYCCIYVWLSHLPLYSPSFHPSPSSSAEHNVVTQLFCLLSYRVGCVCGWVYVCVCVCVCEWVRACVLVQKYSFYLQSEAIFCRVMTIWLVLITSRPVWGISLIMFFLNIIWS